MITRLAMVLAAAGVVLADAPRTQSRPLPANKNMKRIVDIAQELRDAGKAELADELLRAARALQRRPVFSRGPATVQIASPTTGSFFEAKPGKDEEDETDEKPKRKKAGNVFFWRQNDATKPRFREALGHGAFGVVKPNEDNDHVAVFLPPGVVQAKKAKHATAKTEGETEGQEQHQHHHVHYHYYGAEAGKGAGKATSKATRPSLRFMGGRGVGVEVPEPPKPPSPLALPGSVGPAKVALPAAPELPTRPLRWAVGQGSGAAGAFGRKAAPAPRASRAVRAPRARGGRTDAPLPTRSRAPSGSGRRSTRGLPEAAPEPTPSRGARARGRGASSSSGIGLGGKPQTAKAPSPATPRPAGLNREVEALRNEVNELRDLLQALKTQVRRRARDN